MVVLLLTVYSKIGQSYNESEHHKCVIFNVSKDSYQPQSIARRIIKKFYFGWDVQGNKIVNYLLIMEKIYFIPIGFNK